MISALHGASGRADATYAALLLARAHRHAGEPVTLVRIYTRPEATLPDDPTRDDLFPTVERRCANDHQAALIADEEIAAAVEADQHLVLDLPLACLASDVLRSRTDATLLVVGPTALDERTAAAALLDRTLMPSPQRLAHDAGDPAESWTSRPWLLGSGQPGGDPAANAFARAMAVEIDGPEREGLRVLPFVLPPLTRADMAALVSGDAPAALLRAGAVLRAAVGLIAERPDAPVLGRETIAAAAALTGRLLPDQRGLGERMRDLGEALEAVRDGLGPTEEELEDAPVLDGWAVVEKAGHALVGRVQGHPSLPDGRIVTTSDLYAIDPHRTWARTMSRWFRLARPASEVASTSH